MTLITQDQTQANNLFPPVSRIWRTGLAGCLSIGVHALLLFLLWHKLSPSLPELPDAGRTGGVMSVMLLPDVQTIAPPPSPEAQSEPTAVQAEQPKSVVAERAEIVVEKKNSVRETPRRQKAVAEKPEETAKKVAPPREAPRRMPVVSPSPKPTPSAVNGTPSAQPTAAPMIAASAASKPGESDSGEAVQGGGKSTSTVVRILHRRVNYPNRARSMGLEGQVKVKFDITAAGTITNIRILAETPRDVFSSDLRRDISRWRYVTTGPVNDRVVTVIFKIDGRIQLIS